MLVVCNGISSASASSSSATVTSCSACAAARRAPAPGRSLAVSSTTARAEVCALRELEEETGGRSGEPRLVAETDEAFPEGMRYRTLFVHVD
jgi:hypothetical protein